jgi:hypothetical protein
MLRPQCVICEDPASKSARWWEKCQHNPYIISTEVPHKENVIETVDGERVITGQKTRLLADEYPSMRQVELTSRINVGRQVERERAKGSILPEEFRGEFRGEQINGFATFCQYRDCWSQNIKVSNEHGDYCRVEEAKLVAAEETGKRLELLIDEKRRDQLAGINVG